MQTYSMQTYDPPFDVLNADLCILAYQLYHQSVVWPLDPWYECLATGGSDRRTNHMREVRSYLSSLPLDNDRLLIGERDTVKKQANEALDPIITNYTQIDPGAPAWSKDDAHFLTLQAPSYLTHSIGKVSVCSYTEFPKTTMTTIAPLKVGEGRDELIAFEGGTGVAWGEEGPPGWSLMGYVLKRHRSDGKYDIHIVFRGSRSGSAEREAVWTTRNPDWVTDIGKASGKLAAIPFISKVGKVAKGFAGALRYCCPAIAASLHQLTGAGHPCSIWVTGHSLGAALAAQFCAWIKLGGMHPDLGPRNLPWKPSLWENEVKGYFFAVPPTGDEFFAETFNREYGRRCLAPYVHGDMVVECSSSVSVGSILRNSSSRTIGLLASGKANGHTAGILEAMNRPGSATGNDNSHELYLIRIKLLKHSEKKTGLDIGSQLHPWLVYDTFMDMLNEKPISFRGWGAPLREAIINKRNLREVLRRHRFADRFQLYLNLYSKVVGNPKAYAGYHRDSTYKERGDEVIKLADQLRSVCSDDPPLPGPPAAADNDRAACVKAIEALSLLLKKRTSKSAKLLALGVFLSLVEKRGCDRELDRPGDLAPCLTMPLT